jgi:ankyrin repeat protein
LGVFSADIDWFWYCLLISLPLSTIGAIMLGVLPSMTSKPHDQRIVNLKTTQTLLMLLLISISGALIVIPAINDVNSVEVAPPSDSTTLGTHPLTIVDRSGTKPLGGTSSTHQDDASGITTYSFESANGRHKITLVDKVLTVNGQKYTLENPNDSIRIVGDRVEITRVMERPEVGNTDDPATATKAHRSPVEDIQPAESDASAIRKTTAFLVEAAKSGDLEAVKAALESGVDPNGPRDQLTALHWAVAQRISDGETIEPSPEIAKRLIEAGANVNAKDYLGQTPLEWAATHAPPEVVTMLIKAGADVNAESRYGTVLMAARRVEIAKLLIEAGADVNAGKITSPLAKAAMQGDVPLIRLLIENGAKVDDGPYYPPIHCACKPDVAKVLLDAGADVNKRNAKGETALHLPNPHFTPNPATVQVLLEAGADITAKSQSGATPLHAAAQLAKTEIAQLLIASGADLDAKDQQGNTPLSLARASWMWARGQQQVDSRPYEAAVQSLVDAGAKDDGRTELQRAVAAGDLEKVKKLIAAKVNVNETGPQRVTAVHIASEKGHAEILAALIEAGAKFDQTDEQRMRPLHFAANAGIARLLIAKGAKVDSPMPSPLYMATMAGKADVVRELVSNKADIRDSDCAEMLNWATLAGKIEVVKILLEQRYVKSLLGAADVYSPLHVAASGSFGGMNRPQDVTPERRLDIAKLLVEKGADVNARWGANVNPQSGAAHMIGTTPLMFASAQGDIEMVKFLIDQQADAKAANASGQTALHFAAQHGHRSVVESLLDANADVNALTREAKTPLNVTQDAAVKILLIQKDGKTASEILEDSQR